MSVLAPSPAASGGRLTPSTNALSPSSNGSAPGNNSSPPPKIQPSSPPPTSSPPSTNSTSPPPSTPSTNSTSPPPTPSANSPPPPTPSTNSTSPPPVSSPPASSPPPPSAPPSTSPPPAASRPAPTAQSPPPPVNAPPPIVSPSPPASSPPPTNPSPPPPTIPKNPSTPPIAAPPSSPTSPSPPSASPPIPSSIPSSPTSRSASPPTSPPTPKSPSPKKSPPPAVAPPPTGTPSPTTTDSPPSVKAPSSSNPTPPNSLSPIPNSTTSGTNSSEPDSTSGGGVSSSTTVIAVISVAVVVALVAFGVLMWYRRKKKRRDGYRGDYYGPPPPGSFSHKSDGMYASKLPSSDQCFVNTTPSLPGPGPVHDNVYNGSKWSSGDTGVQRLQATTSGLGNSKSWFTYEELAVATNGFSPQNVLGEGGFGCVYKGYLQDGKVVAVKQLKSGGGQGEREFRAEVEIISRVHHRHLVSLVGYCIAESQRLLVYEYVPNGTLEYHLHGRGRPVMDWKTRLRIAIGAARGIAYLHEDCHPRIIHRDIKSANILLDDRFEAQVSDFGLAKLALDAHTHVTTRVMGTFGYMAPEYAASGKLTQRSDVFSFGVVLLELVTGRKPVDASQPLGDESLVEWARPLLSHALEEGDFEAFVDPRLEKHFDQFEMFRMIEAAAACVRHSAQRRPRMGQVARALENDAAIADLNNGVKPGQSTMYNSAQYSADIRRFRRMAFGSQDIGSDFSGVSSEYEMTRSTSSSEVHRSKEVEAKHSRQWKADMESASGSEYPSSESETRPINLSYSRKYETGERGSGEVPPNFPGQSLRGR